MSLGDLGLVAGIVLAAGGIAVLATLAVSSYNARRARIQEYGDADVDGTHEMEQYEEYFAPIRESLRKESALYGVNSDAPTEILTLDWVHEGLEEPAPLDEALVAEPALWFGCTPDTTAAWPMISLLKDDRAANPPRPVKTAPIKRPAELLKKPSRFDAVRELSNDVSAAGSAFAPVAPGRRPKKRAKAHRGGPSATLRLSSGPLGPLPPGNARQLLRAADSRIAAR